MLVTVDCCEITLSTTLFTFCFYLYLIYFLVQKLCSSQGNNGPNTEHCFSLCVTVDVWLMVISLVRVERMPICLWPEFYDVLNITGETFGWFCTINLPQSSFQSVLILSLSCDLVLVIAFWPMCILVLVKF